ncbi:MAG: hypothetical protein NVS2B2_06200 [Ktedonobacteraceae bacterium]
MPLIGTSSTYEALESTTKYNTESAIRTEGSNRSRRIRSFAGPATIRRYTPTDVIGLSVSI